MLFHSWPFLLFVLIVLPVFYALRPTRLWIPWLLAASYFFYAWWNPYFLLLVIYSTALDYLLVTLMDHCPPVDAPSSVLTRLTPGPADKVLRRAFWISSVLTLASLAAAAFARPDLRPALLAFSVLVLLMAVGSLLGSRRAWLLISLFYKYARFVGDNLNLLFGALHVPVRMPDPSALMPQGLKYALPVGISFFTFQSMSYTIDFYLGRVGRERNFLRFATFVCFFPQLMAGPIERARQMLPQFRQPPAFRLQNLTDGMSLFLVGLFKKVALANYLGMYVDRVYDNPAAFGATPLVLATFAFAWQIFFDFSGYTDMARGEHMVAESQRPKYRATRDRAASWLRQSGVTLVVPEVLPSESYADASHPLTQGYELLAERIAGEPTFRRWMAGEGGR